MLRMDDICPCGADDILTCGQDRAAGGWISFAMRAKANILPTIGKQ